MAGRLVYLFDAAVCVILNSKRSYFSHTEALKHKPSRFPCCLRWDRKARKWTPTESPCPDGTHDQLRCSGVVQRFNKKVPTKPSKSKQRPFNLILQAEGEQARFLKHSPEGMLVYITGNQDLLRMPGTYMPMLHVQHAVPMSDQQFRSVLISTAINKVRAYQRTAIACEG